MFLDVLVILDIIQLLVTDELKLVKDLQLKYKLTLKLNKCNFHSKKYTFYIDKEVTPDLFNISKHIHWMSKTNQPPSTLC